MSDTVDDLLNKLREAMRAEARADIISSLGDPEPKAKGVKPALPPRASAPKARPVKRKPGRRSAAELEEAAERLFSYLKANPGSRMDEIVKKTGEPTSTLTRPMEMLLKSKKVTKKGAKNGTTYTVR